MAARPPPDCGRAVAGQAVGRPPGRSAAAGRALMVYEIVVEGRVQGTLSRALDGFVVVPGPACHTCFRGSVEDNAGLQAVLGQIVGCNMVLTSVRQVQGSTEAARGR